VWTRTRFEGRGRAVDAGDRAEDGLQAGIGGGCLLQSPPLFDYFTDMVTLGWLRREPVAAPTETVSETAEPVETVGGTMALTWTRPATAPGAAPA